MAYKLFKEKTKYSLHQAVRMKREDVLFLYLIDNDAEVNIPSRSIDQNFMDKSLSIS
jgi:hypothetical protein